MDNLKDLLYTSLQNVVALNDLATTLTLRVADLTLSLAQTRADIQSRDKQAGSWSRGGDSHGECSPGGDDCERRRGRQ